MAEVLRRDIVSAISVINSVWRMGDHVWSLEKLLSNLDYYENPLLMPIQDGLEVSYVPASLEYQKVHAERNAQQIKLVAEKARLFDIAVGCTDLTIKAADVTSDCNIKEIVDSCLPVFASADRLTLAALAEDFARYIPKVDRKLKITDLDMRNLTIAHDCLDAASYESQGIDSYSGQPIAINPALVADRLKVAGDFLSMVWNAEANDLRSIWTEASSLLKTQKIAKVGQFLDGALPKMKLFRRWWALNG